MAFKADDNPSSNTKLYGGTLDYAYDQYGSVGGGYYYLNSDIDTRDGMSVYDIRANLTPILSLPGLNVQGEYVYEDNGSVLEASGFYGLLGYHWDQVFGQPTLSYRYAGFEGDKLNTNKVESFDPLFYGFDDWGTWFQGEILGEYMLSNSNLNSHQIRMTLTPNDSVVVNLMYYNLRIDRPESFGISSENFADEWDLMVDWSATSHLSFSAVGGYATASDGATEYTGGNDNWAYMMLYAKVSY